MGIWECTVCGYLYDPAANDGVIFANLPDSYACPECGAGKDVFNALD